MIEKIKYLTKTGTQTLVDNIKELIIIARDETGARVDVVDDKISEFSEKIDEFEDGLDWKQAVETFDDIATTYPEPEDGWTVNVKDIDYTYRYNGEDWIPISANAIPDATLYVNGLMTTEKVAKLNELENYVLPVAGTAKLGGIKPDGVSLVIDPESGVARAIGENNELSELTNVEIINPLNGQTLVYDEVKEKWVNGGGSQVQLDDVTGANVQTVVSTQSAVLTWTDPSDVEISGKKFAEWSGTKVIRKEGSAPTSVDDGDLIVDSKVRNQYSLVGYEDSGLEFNIVYYYRFFPYTTTELYTTGTALSCSLELTTVAIPEQSGSLTYDGTNQSPIWSSSEGYSASGRQSAIDAGTYYMTATLLPGYIWSDETIEAKQIPWEINKATSEIVATPDSLQLDLTHLSTYTTLSNLLNRTIDSIVVDDDSIIVATYDSTNNRIMVEHVNQTSGVATITITTTDSANYNASTIVVSVTASFVSTVLNDNSWDAINQAAINGTASSLWNVGDRKIVNISRTYFADGYLEGDFCVYIIGFNHNAEYSGGNDIHFQFGFDSLTDGVHICFNCSNSNNVNKVVTEPTSNYYQMNSVRMNNSSTPTYSSIGGWTLSQMRLRTIPKFIQILPDDLKVVLQRKPIYTCVASPQTESTVAKTFDCMFLLADFEYYNSTSYSPNYEQTKQIQYAYYANGNSNIMYKYNANTAVMNHWTRTIGKNTGTYCLIGVNSSSQSTVSWSTTQYSRGFAPAFIVGKIDDNEAPSWSTATDEEIIEALDAFYNGDINIYNYWKVGDERTIQLSGSINEEITMVIMNCGGKLIAGSITECAFIVGQKNCLSTLMNMNSTATANGGWGSSLRRTWLNGTYRSAFPDSIVDIFKSHTTCYNNGAYSNSGARNLTSDYFVLPSSTEINGVGNASGATNYSDRNWNHQFEYYYATTNRNKKQGDDGTSNIEFWTREAKQSSSSSSSPTQFESIGGLTYGNANLNKGIAPFGVI